MDLDSIPFGVDFRTHISESLNRCHTLLVVIGSQWLGASTEGSCRIDDPTDFVRLEVAQALARNIRVIPLLIDRTEMPSCTVLPDDLKNLAFRNALRVDSGADFRHHMDRLCSSLQRVSGGFDPQATSPPPAEPLSSPPLPVPIVSPHLPQAASPQEPTHQRLRQSKGFLYKGYRFAHFPHDRYLTCLSRIY